MEELLVVSSARHFLEILAVGMDRCFKMLVPTKHRSHFDTGVPRFGWKIKAQAYIQGYTVDLAYVILVR